jgi:hypothetical protein
MKQGDIVELVSPTYESMLESCHSWDAIRTLLKTDAEKFVSEPLTVKDVKLITFCGIPSEAIEFYEITGAYTIRHFQLVGNNNSGVVISPQGVII